ncbi:unnamed protein product [Heligmosomoides polygyrus]|uniref:RT_RNaseH_2 domain-containing protein n=1 Tax=Heligmosomoides polygyrus TaxID=6339 RepID=A0A183GP38_HELPZ|nr:unnamed protein product [Heligmosomoides polygyrus]
MANFFRLFVTNFSLIAAPLYELMRDKVKFSWSPRQAEAFAKLKRLFDITSLPSERAEGDNRLVAIGYFSKTLSECQQKWNTVPTIPVVDGAPISINRRSVILTEGQRQALAIGTTPFPIVGIQTAFGTDSGKTGAGRSAHHPHRHHERSRRPDN